MQRKLLFYINAIHEGGAERVILQLAKHFSEVGYESILVTSFVDQNEYEVPKGVKRLSIEKEQLNQNIVIRNWNRVKALRKIIKLEKPDATISFMAEPNARNIIACMGLKTKAITSVRNDPNIEYSGLLGAMIGKFLLPLSSGCVFQTKDAMMWFPKRLQKKGQIIFNDVDKVFFETKYVGGKSIVTLGRLNPQKNQMLLIQAFQKIADKYPDVELHIYGTGELEKQLYSFIRDLGLEKRIHLDGLTKNSAHVLSTAKVFVLSSDYEGMPNALLEALAVGVPSISTDCPCGGPKTVIINGENGILVPVGNPEALAEALNQVLSNQEYADRLANNAKKQSKMFDTEVVFKQWKDYIDKVIARR